MSQRIYFDNNATTPLDPEVIKTIQMALDQQLFNPSSPHQFGQSAKGFLSDARRTISDFFKLKQNQIIFTSGGSEGASLCLRGFGKQSHIIASTIEHACVYETLEDLKKDGAEITYLPVGLTGCVNPQDIEAAIRPNTSLITIMAANNETGVINDINSIGTIATKHKIPFVVDGVAILGKEQFTIPEGVSAMFFSGHKVHAPQGVGFVCVKPRLKLKPIILGGSQEFGMRGGTENMLGIISLAKAIYMLNPQDIEKIRELRDKLESALLQLPGVSLNGTGSRVSNTTNLCFSKMDGEALLVALDQAGIAVSLGSACSSGAIEPSRVLLNMGLSVPQARSSLRFSLSRLNTADEVDRAIEIIRKIYRV